MPSIKQAAKEAATIHSMNAEFDQYRLRNSHGRLHGFSSSRIASATIHEPEKTASYLSCGRVQPGPSQMVGQSNYPASPMLGVLPI